MKNTLNNTKTISSAENGKYGEALAAEYLSRKGFQILKQNLRVSHEEIDILAENEEYLVFAEVKTRTVPYLDEYGNSPFPSTPAMAVNRKKQKHLFHAASVYLLDHETEKQPRLDVIEVYLKQTGFGSSGKPELLRIHHIENAFGR